MTLEDLSRLWYVVEGLHEAARNLEHINPVAQILDYQKKILEIKREVEAYYTLKREEYGKANAPA
jgi:acetolactate synthase small subunit